MFAVTVSAVSDVPHGHAELRDGEASPVAQFVKRVGWTETRSNATGEAEAQEMRSAIEKLQRAGRREYRSALIDSVSEDAVAIRRVKRARQKRL